MFRKDYREAQALSSNQLFEAPIKRALQHLS